MNIPNTLAAAVASAAVATAAVPALADPELGWRHGHHLWGGGWVGMGIGVVAMLLFWTAVILIVVLVVRWLTTGSAPASTDAPGERAPAEDPAMRILRERFARGEIDEEEFMRRRQTLES